jgi:CBS domain-containing protein
MGFEKTRRDETADAEPRHFASRKPFSESLSRKCTDTMGCEKEDRRGRMRIGYTRVSTDEQSLDLQLDALKKARCKRVFTDKASATKSDRPGLADAVSHLRSGDVLVIWKLDRLGRTVKGLVEFVADLQERGVQFRSLTDGIDTTTPAGRFFFHVMASLAQIVTESDFGAKERGVPFSTLRLPQLFNQWMPPREIERIYEAARTTTAGEIMSMDLVVASEETPVDEMVRHMIYRDINHVPVTRDGVPVGIISRHDLLQMMVPDVKLDDSAGRSDA